MKTIKEWLSELPEPYRTQALENMSNSTTQRDSLKLALHAAFSWGESNEGFDYWENFYDTL